VSTKCWPFIHEIGVDPHKSAEIRSLGLINEQIDWKQRFFVPTDEETGIGVLTDLLSRYPVLASEVLTDDEPPLTDIEPTDLALAKIIDLDEWCVPVADSEQSMEPPPLHSERAQEIETAEAGWTLPAFYFARPSQAVREVEEIQLALDFG
jgi:hypothetical protein